jgi:hypothetical protein
VLVEREPGETATNVALLDGLAALAQQHDATRGLTDLRVYPGSFPVDTRHNAKIEREKLAVWASVREPRGTR